MCTPNNRYGCDTLVVHGNTHLPLQYGILNKGVTDMNKFLPILYEVPFDEKYFIPKSLGVYILRSKNEVYCGYSENLDYRVVSSARERGIGEDINYFTTDLVTFSERICTLEFTKELEINTIAALNTLIWVNGLPVILRNIKNVSFLPQAAWDRKEKNQYIIAIKIAQTALVRMGVPFHMVGLGYHGALNTSIPQKTRSFVESNWSKLIEEDRRHRASGNYPATPLMILHPA